jgi:hypothetical protein
MQTRGCRSVVIVCLRTQSHGVCLFFVQVMKPLVITFRQPAFATASSLFLQASSGRVLPMLLEIRLHARDNRRIPAFSSIHFYAHLCIANLKTPRLMTVSKQQRLMPVVLCGVGECKADILLAVAWMFLKCQHYSGANLCGVLLVQKGQQLF